MRFCIKEDCEKRFHVSIDDVPFPDYAVYMEGSYNVLAAKLFGLSFPNYLRYVRDNYNAELRGRVGYTYCVFRYEKDAKRLIIDLNKEWEKVEKAIKEKNNND